MQFEARTSDAKRNFLGWFGTRRRRRRHQHRRRHCRRHRGSARVEIRQQTDDESGRVDAHTQTIYGTSEDKREREKEREN